MFKVISGFFNFFSSGHKRSVRIKKNILLIFLLKIPAVVIDFYVLRLILDYLEPLKYGIWITLVSLVGWLSFSDFGIATGLRNRLAESLAKSELDKARRYVSTSYILMTILSLLIVFVFAAVNQFVNWEWILNAPKEMYLELNQLAFWMVFFSAFYLVTGLIRVILKATQVPSASTAIELITSIFSLVAVWILLNTTSNSIILLGFWHSLLIAVSPLIITGFFFTIFYPELFPSFKCFDLNCIRDVLNLGSRFFVIQICSLIIFTTDSLIITHMLGPEFVTTYMIVFKYFHILTTGFAMISVPFWSAFTEAYVKKDFLWIRRAIYSKIMILLPLILIATIMLFTGRFLIEEIWLGRELGIDFTLLVMMAVYVFVSAWNRIFSWFLSGVGVLSVNLYTMIIGAIINIPLSIILIENFSIGSAGAILGTIFSISLLLLQAQ